MVFWETIGDCKRCMSKPDLFEEPALQQCPYRSSYFSTWLDQVFCHLQKNKKREKKKAILIICKLHHKENINYTQLFCLLENVWNKKCMVGTFCGRLKKTWTLSIMNACQSLRLYKHSSFVTVNCESSRPAGLTSRPKLLVTVE